MLKHADVDADILWSCDVEFMTEIRAQGSILCSQYDTGMK